MLGSTQKSCRKILVTSNFVDTKVKNNLYGNITKTNRLHLVMDNTRCGQDSSWKSQSEWQTTKINNGENIFMVWPTVGWRTAEEQNRTVIKHSNF